MKRLKIMLSALCLSVVMVLSGCGVDDYVSVEVLSQKPMSKDRVNVTVLVKYAFTINAFEKAVEEQFPNINLIQVGNHTSDMGIAEYEARLEHDDLTDVVMTWPLDVGKEYWADRLMDLSTLSVTSRYTTKSLNEISYGSEGKLYYLPGPSQVRGILYNKTLFAENGWNVPTSYEGFAALCKTIEASGIRALQLGLQNAEVFDTAFVGYGFADSFATAEDAAALAAFNRSEGTFATNFMPALESFQRLIDDKIIQKGDISVDYSQRENMFANRRCAMAEDSVLLANMMHEQSPTGDEYCLMPFFNEGEHNDWSRLYPICYIGLNKHLPEDQTKYKAVMDLVDYISTPEGQTALSADTSGMFSSLKGVYPPDAVEIDCLQSSLNAGRYGVFPTLKNAQNALRNGLKGMLLGEMTAQDVVAAVDEENLNPPAVLLPSIIGTADSSFTLVETGNLVADAMREFADTDIALILDNGKDGQYNGKGISAKIYEGVVTTIDMKRIMPDMKYPDTGDLVKIKILGENLIDTLEKSIMVDNTKSGWFYYFSGLRMTFAPAETPGRRIRKITDDKGNQIDPKLFYSVVVKANSINPAYMIEPMPLGKTLATVTSEYISKNSPISPSRDGRLTLA